MSADHRLREIARSLYTIGGYLFSSTGTQLQIHAQELRDIADFVQNRLQTAEAVRDEAIAGRSKLRQAVKDLTASSEKLRAVNQAAVAKALQQDRKIREMEKSREYKAYRELTAELNRLTVERDDAYSLAEKCARKVIDRPDVLPHARHKIDQALRLLSAVLSGRDCSEGHIVYYPDTRPSA